MEPNASPSERLRRGLLTLVVVLGLLALVALASKGATPLGTSGTRRPSDRVLDVFLSIGLVIMGLGAVIFFYLAFLRRDVLRERARRRQERSRWHSFVIGGIAFLILAVVVRISSERFARGDQGTAGRARPPIGTTTGSNGPSDAYQGQFTWVPVLVVLSLGAAASVAVYLAARARRPPLPPLDPSSLAEALADVLELSLDDLRAEKDPRRAVIGAYARLERTLAAYGLPRRPSEAPFEYVERMLGDLAVSSVSIARLTQLFERAKFSQHEVAPEMKDEAIDALEMIQFELRAAEIRAAEERAAALEAARERAAQ